jgi:hypothetical protein
MFTRTRHRFDYTVKTHRDSRTTLSIFEQMFSTLLQHPLGWRSHGYEFVRTKGDGTDGAGDNPHFTVVLTPQSAMDALFPSFSDNRLSVADTSNPNNGTIYVNEQRWFRKIPDQSDLVLAEYRAYLVSHEVGHVLGRGHATCPGPGELAPVMMQQTLGHGACVPDPWPKPGE